MNEPCRCDVLAALTMTRVRNGCGGAKRKYLPGQTKHHRKYLEEARDGGLEKREDNGGRKERRDSGPCNRLFTSRFMGTF